MILQYYIIPQPKMTNVVLITGGSGLVGNAIKAIVPEFGGEFTEKNTFIYISSADYNLSVMNETEQMFIKYKPDYVIHLAACVGGLYKNMNNKVAMLEQNLTINYNMVHCAHKFKVKKMVAFLSTCIFPDKTTYPIDETMLHNGPPHFSNDAYAYAKRMLEIHCRMYRENYGDNFVCVIPTNIYGHHDNFDLEDGHVLPALIHKCFLAKQENVDFIVRGSGKPMRQFIYSDDLARLVLAILFDNGQKITDTIILSVSEADEVSIGDVARKIANCFDYGDRIRFDESFSDGQYKKTASNQLLVQKFPDFRFTDIDAGIAQTVKWFLQNQDIVRK